MNLYALSVNHRANPLGINSDEQPYFGWKLKSEKPNTMQAAYRLRIYADDTVCFDSGRVETACNAFVCGPDLLRPQTFYRWAVTVWDNHGENTTAESSFETSLSSKAWKADWMRTPRAYVQRKKGFGTQPPATLFRRVFTLSAAPRRARLYATCLGVYRLTVNGKRPDMREFAPEHTSYKGLLCFQTYDLTALLHIGENVLGMEVGDGWYCCPQTQPPIDGLQPDHTVLFQLEIENADGTHTRICSDESVLTHESAVRASDIFDGELYDARLALPGWDMPGFTAADWLPAVKDTKQSDSVLYPQFDDPVICVKELPAQCVYTSPKGETIVDFGQVIAGRARVTVDLPTGAAVTLEHFEAVDAKGNYFNNIDSAMGITEQKDVFISDGTPHTFEARFTFHGFRYLRVSGVGNPIADQFVAVVLSTEKTNAGTFECSNADLNRLYQNTRWSQCANMMSIPTDCPQREKAGWTGDISLYAKTALLNEDVTPFLTQWLQSLCVDQRENGSIPFTVPDVSIYHYAGIQMGEQTGCGGPVCSAGWGDAAVTVPMAMYEVTGNIRILEKQYDSMKGWCDYVISRARIHAPNSTLPDEVEEHLWDTGFQFGEWLVPSLAGAPQEQLFTTMATTSAYTTPIFGWLVVHKIAQAATVLGREEDAVRYQEEADKMKRAIRAALITADGVLRYERQGAYTAYLYMDANHNGQLTMRLTRDFLEAEEKICWQYEGLHAPFSREAPAVFEHGGKWYMLTSGMTGYVPNKSDSAVSDAPDRPFVSIGDPHADDASHASFNSQISQVFKVPGKRDLYIALADRWVPDYPVDAKLADLLERCTAQRFDPEHYKATSEEMQTMMQSPMLTSANTSRANYVWLPITFEEGKPKIYWRDSWKLSDFE